MTTIKEVLICLLCIYIMMFAVDYISVRQSATKDSCQNWFKILPLWAHFILPGTGNACIDKGMWP